MYQIALYPFELQISCHSASLTVQAVLSSFRKAQQSLPVQINHEPLLIETPACNLHFSTHQHVPLVKIEVHRNADPLSVVDYVEPEIVNQAIRESVGLLWIHGACLVRGEEKVLLVAETGTGKTTLSLGMLVHGYKLVTDDIILIDVQSQQIIPVPRCPKVRSPALEFLRSVGFDISLEAQMYGRYTVLPPERFYTQPVALPINRVYLLGRTTAGVRGSVHYLDLTSGILGLLSRSNLFGLDPSLSAVYELFGQTQFIDMKLSHFPTDLQLIANGFSHQL